jgi:hypothetical protein
MHYGVRYGQISTRINGLLDLGESKACSSIGVKLDNVTAHVNTTPIVGC